MVGVGYVRVTVAHGLVSMRMAVRADRSDFVQVVVVPVVVRVRMLVLDGLVCVLVTVGLGQMQRHTRQHQPATDSHPDAERSIA